MGSGAAAAAVAEEEAEAAETAVDSGAGPDEGGPLEDMLRAAGGDTQEHDDFVV